MRCPNCNKFPSVEMGEVESEVEVGDSSITGNVRIVLTCADCGEELKEANFDVSVALELKHAEDCLSSEGESELELDFEPEAFDEFVPPNKKRQKHMYGASAEATVTCPSCKATATASWRDSVQSSGMEELT